MNYHSRNCFRLSRMRSFLDRTNWPRNYNWVVDNRTYLLPHKFKPVADPNNLPLKEQHYLSHAFSGDGCVSTEGRRGCKLTLASALSTSHWLIRFANAFGGSITFNRHGKGLCQPMIVWAVHGQNARTASIILSKSHTRKTDQLVLASIQPVDRLTQLCRISKMSRLKLDPFYNDNFITSWEQFAGLFDADGSIGIPSTSGACIILSIRNNNRAIPNAVVNFLKQDINCNPGKLSRFHKIYDTSQFLVYTWYQSQTSSSRYILQQLLNASLTAKRLQAVAALGLNNTNWLEIREQIFLHSGGLHKYNRYASYSCTILSLIKEYSRQVSVHKKSGNTHKAEALNATLSMLKLSLNIYHTSSTLSNIRSDIRNLLIP